MVRESGAVNQVIHSAKTTSGASVFNHPDHNHMHRPWNLHFFAFCDQHELVICCVFSSHCKQILTFVPNFASVVLCSSSSKRSPCSLSFNIHKLDLPFHTSTMDRRAWQLTVHRVTKSCKWLKWLSPHTHHVSGSVDTAVNQTYRKPCPHGADNDEGGDRP